MSGRPSPALADSEVRLQTTEVLLAATDAQVSVALYERARGRTQLQAAAKAGLSDRRTVAKYERCRKMPSEMKKIRTYRTREDPFAKDWPALEEMLVDAPELEAKALFEWLCGERPGRYQEGQLRTLQRRLSNWRALNVPQILTLEQVREPGRLMQTDGMWMTEFGITIQGEPLDHLLIHSVLVYSNWEWGTVAQSESLLAISRGFQEAVRELRHVPQVHQTDNTTAATHDLREVSEDVESTDSGRVYNEHYRALLDHYRVEPRTTHLDCPDENGDIEAANGAFGRALKQHLLLRGSRDFESFEEYEGWLQEIMRKRNRLRSKRLTEEFEVMKPLEASMLPAMREYRPRVSRNGTIQVLENTYSLPSGLKGREVVVHVYEWHIKVYFGGKLVRQMPRLKGKRKRDINYRHVIHTLLKKPGGFRNYLYRDEMFPRPAFRAAWEDLDQRLRPRQADMEYLRVLKLAADNLETDVELALELLLDSGETWDHATVADLVKPTIPPAPVVERPVVELSLYDQLLTQEVVYEPA